MEKYDGVVGKEKRKRDYTLAEIVKGVTLKQIHEQNKAKQIISGRKLFVFISKEYGYKGKEIAEYIRRDPAIISTVLKDRKRFIKDMERVVRSLKKLNI
jgi:hypothetical protein